MLPSPPAVRQVGVLGAGTMGAGIAQVAAQAGCAVRLYDLEEAFLARGRQAVEASLARLVARGALAEEERAAALGRLSYTTALGELAACELLIEAVPERLDLKASLFRQLHEVCAPGAVLATNTSTLSVTEIGRASGRPERVVGLHFFNPPVVLKLVEVVRGAATAPDVVEWMVGLARAFGKVPVVCQDTPGFLVNRVVRPFYLESLFMLGEGTADVAAMDGALRGVGFPMGPFELMDLIGLDVNLASSQSVFEQRFSEPRFRPHLVQQALVRAGHLGRKTGRGFYDHATSPPAPAYLPARARQPQPDGPWEQWAHLAPGDAAAIVGRVLSGLVNEAYFAYGEGVATEEDLEAAVQLGMSFPKGLLAWGREIGLKLVLETQLALESWYRDGRHPPAPALRWATLGGGDVER